MPPENLKTIPIINTENPLNSGTTVQAVMPISPRLASSPEITSQQQSPNLQLNKLNSKK